MPGDADLEAAPTMAEFLRLSGDVSPLGFRLLTLLPALALACPGTPPLRSTPPPEVDDDPPPAPPTLGEERSWYDREPEREGSSGASDEASRSLPHLEADCEGPIPVYAAGVRTELGVCEQSERFTIVSLADDWAPRIFAADPELGPDHAPPYRAAYVALANEDHDALDDLAAARHYLELLGIFPTPTVLERRLGDAERHRCHAAVDDAALETLDAARDPSTAWPAAAIHARSQAAVAAIETAQRHLVCDGLLGEDEADRGVLDEPTRKALRLFQRKQMVVGNGHIDEGTARALAMDSREQDFRAVLRMLRERVVDATGLLADGSASRGWSSVLGRVLDPPEIRSTGRQPPAPSGSPDRVSDATEAAAESLGLTDPDAAAERLAELPDRVAVRLPREPGFDRAGRDTVLWAEVHRGPDPRHADPHSPRPVLTLYALRDGRPVALVRWPTTIGGNKDEQTPEGRIRTRYFESPLGRRLWRQLIVSPTWLPPRDTPDETLIRGDQDDWELERAIIGPGYDSAYGLVMIIHELPQRTEAGVRFVDEGIRTHGSVNYHSILGGTSHGCHRVYNHLAVRLAGYLLTHRRHHREGNEEVEYRHEIDFGGESRTLEVSSRGYRYDLARPVPVLVIDGEAPGPNDSPSREEALR